MAPELIFGKLSEVLVAIQTMSGLECPPITMDLKPAESLKKFDSKIWPVATGMLASAIGKQIPNDANIFAMKGSRTALTIRETIAFVIHLIDKKPALAAE